MNTTVVDDTMSSGKGWCDYPQGAGDATGSAAGYPIDYVQIQQCNYGLNYCQYINVGNPYKG